LELDAHDGHFIQAWPDWAMFVPFLNHPDSGFDLLSLSTMCLKPQQARSGHIDQPNSGQRRSLPVGRQTGTYIDPAQEWQSENHFFPAISAKNNRSFDWFVIG
jgi:hypothetical protein